MTKNSSSLTPAERVARYRSMAEYALRQADLASTPGLRDAFLKVADGWKELITAAERISRSSEDARS